MAQNYKGNLSEMLKRFTYQPKLTAKLDTLPNAPFSQEIINEIVLWKVNRYARLPDDVRNTLHKLRKLDPKSHRPGEQVLRQLLECSGVDLPMASTILRFQNANVFQIIDRHAYRAVFGVAYPLYAASNPKAKISTYFKYLDALHGLAQSSQAPFCDLDRILYIFDKEQNGTL
jgi:hypothetical protein